MSAPRLPDWQARYGAFVESRRLMPFAWGSNDCCTLAADCAKAITGVDPIPAALRNHGDEKADLRRLEALGGVGGVGDAFAGPVVPVLMARVGDVGLVHAEGREGLAVCNGETWLTVGRDGLVTLPLRAATRAWRV